MDKDRLDDFFGTGDPHSGELSEEFIEKGREEVQRVTEETMELAKKVDEFYDADEKRREKIAERMREPSAVYLATMASENPMMMMLSQELSDLLITIAKIAYYFGVQDAKQ